MPGVQARLHVVPLTLDRCHDDVGAYVNLACFLSYNLGLVFRKKKLYCPNVRRSIAHIIINYKLDKNLIKMYAIKWTVKYLTQNQIMLQNAGLCKVVNKFGSCKSYDCNKRKVPVQFSVFQHQAYCSVGVVRAGRKTFDSWLQPGIFSTATCWSSFSFIWKVYQA